MMLSTQILATVLLICIHNPGLLYAEIQDDYDFMQLPRTASQDDLKKSYRKLAVKLHPDHNGGTIEANEAFKKLGQAYKNIEEYLKTRSPYTTEGGGFGPARARKPQKYSPYSRPTQEKAVPPSRAATQTKDEAQPQGVPYYYTPGNAPHTAEEDQEDAEGKPWSLFWSISFGGDVRPSGPLQMIVYCKYKTGEETDVIDLLQRPGMWDSNSPHCVWNRLLIRNGGNTKVTVQEFRLQQMPSTGYHKSSNLDKPVEIQPQGLLNLFVAREEKLYGGHVTSALVPAERINVLGN